MLKPRYETCRTNSLLDRVNDEFFRPRGLYCLIMAYNPIATGAKGQLDDAEAINKSQASSSLSKRSLPGRALKKLRSPVVGTAQGQESLPPNVATLVYPGSTAKSQIPGEPKKKNAMKRLDNYFDQRAQARYVSIWICADEGVTGPFMDRC